MVKLHLGCGMNYLEGYTNVDYPSNMHSVQIATVADIYSDITLLKYNNSTIEEIRLHHVFEHFSRPIGFALLASWNSWLQKNGLLRIEIPDFQKSAKIICSPLSSNKQKSRSVRHLFGSHEASWAHHLEGYTQKTIINIISNYGFSIDKVKKSSWNNTHNLEVFAYKSREITSEEIRVIGKRLLSDYLVDESESELRLLKIWEEQYSKQLDISYTCNDL